MTEAATKRDKHFIDLQNIVGPVIAAQTAAISMMLERYRGCRIMPDRTLLVGVQMLPWLPFSLDLSQIEHIRDAICRLYHGRVQKTNYSKCLTCNEVIPQDVIHTFIDSVPLRVASCIICCSLLLLSVCRVYNFPATPWCYIFNVGYCIYKLQIYIQVKEILRSVIEKHFFNPSGKRNDQA